MNDGIIRRAMSVKLMFT